MAGLGVRVYTDEDVDPRLAQQLQILGYDVVGCHQLGLHNQSLSDELQLMTAFARERAILVFNIKDFIALDTQWRQHDREHWGIILASNRLPIGELVRRARLHLDTIDPTLRYNAVLYLAQ